jgi:hypothetical protein
VATSARVAAAPRLRLGGDSAALSGARRKVLPPGPHLGTTYTKHAAQSAGLSHAEAFKLMHEMGIDTVRLGSYWDAIQPDGPGDWNTSELDEQLALARKYNMKIILTVGMKSPGWPEGYVPGWARPKELKADPPKGFFGKVDAWLAKHWSFYRENRGEAATPTNLAQDPKLREQALAYVGKLVEHVGGNDDIIAFQVENEPGMPFGPNREYVSNDFVAEEIRTIKAADPAKRPLALNTGIPLHDAERELIKMPEIDVVGVDIYPKPGGRKIFGKDRPASIGVHQRMNVDSIEAKRFIEAQGKEGYIAEMQAEDWTVVKWNAGMTIDHFHAQRRNGFEMIMPWNIGHVFRNYQHGDKSHFEAWKRMGREIAEDVPPPPGPNALEMLGGAWRHLKELWTGENSGRI